jgi:hypothetical protein
LGPEVSIFPVARSLTLGAILRDVDPLDQQPDDPRLLGWEQLLPQRIELPQHLALHHPGGELPSSKNPR